MQTLHLLPLIYQSHIAGNKLFCPITLLLVEFNYITSSSSSSSFPVARCSITSSVPQKQQPPMFSLCESILSSHPGCLYPAFNVCRHWMDEVVCFFHYYSYQSIFADKAAWGLEIHLCSRLCSVLSQCVPKHICKWFGSLDHNLSSLAGAFTPVYSRPPALPDGSMITKKCILMPGQ